MEITIDLAAVQRIASAEYRDTRTELRALGSIAALRNSQARHDARLAAAPDADTLACGQGCAWCCHFTVDIRPVEALAILEFVAASFTPLDLQALQRRLAANAQLVSGLDEEQRMRRNVECAFLSEGRCSIYPVRPQTCRNYHATDAAGCRRSYEQPDDLDIDPEFAPHVYQAGGAHVEAVTLAFAHAGYDTAAYEMNAALDAALADPNELRRRYEGRLRAFEAVAGGDVPAEIVEPEMIPDMVDDAP
jgi:Fe-S-cluster containining protein